MDQHGWYSVFSLAYIKDCIVRLRKPKILCAWNPEMPGIAMFQPNTWAKPQVFPVCFCF